MHVLLAHIRLIYVLFTVHHRELTDDQLENEAPLTFNRMIPFDGNNSMKRMYQISTSRVRDLHCFTDSDYLLPPEYVNQYADEVPTR